MSHGHLDLGYYSLERVELLNLRDWRGGEHVLDVGCGAGGNASYLRAQGVGSITGMEPVPTMAERAAVVYDAVICGGAEDHLASLPVRPDVIIAADVLEHTANPEQVLVALLQAADARCELLVSLPNVRHISVLKMLVLKGQWQYQDSGIMDATHLRWFTRKSALELLERSGWSAQKVVPKFNTDRQRAWNGRTLGRAQEFLAEQWLLLCEPAGLSDLE